MPLIFSLQLLLGTAPSDVGYATLVLDEAAGTGNPLAYIALSVLHHSLTAGMCAGVAFSAATVIPNIYAAMMAPVLMDIAGAITMSAILRSLTSISDASVKRSRKTHPNQNTSKRSGVTVIVGGAVIDSGVRS